MLAAAILLVLSCGCSYADRQTADRETAGGDGYEIIVKFSADHDINATIVRAFDDAEAEASLADPVNRLSTELGVPFVYRRLTSGREIVVEVPTRQVYDNIVERIRGSDEIENATFEKRKIDKVSNRPDEILVTLAAGTVAPGRSIDADLFAAHLVSDDRYPVSCEIRPDGRLAVTPDFERLVGVLAKSLASRADIDYAQPNYRVRHYNDAQ